MDLKKITSTQLVCTLIHVHGPLTTGQITRAYYRFKGREIKDVTSTEYDWRSTGVRKRIRPTSDRARWITNAWHNRTNWWTWYSWTDREGNVHTTKTMRDGGVTRIEGQYFTWVKGSSPHQFYLTAKGYKKVVKDLIPHLPSID